MKDLPIISLMGPTASGKTALSIELAKTLNAEIISVDSALIYRDMDIGTAKPSLQERHGIPHHLVDIMSPEEHYSVADFVKDVRNCIAEIKARHRPVILVGGTMLYFNALVYGLSEVPETKVGVRLRVRDEIEKFGLQAVHRKLAKLDPISAEKIHENDSQRTSRAYEVMLATGKPLSYWQSRKQGGLDQKIVSYAMLPPNREVLHRQIELRFDQMLENGLIDEVQTLLQKYQLHKELPSMRCVGYRQVLEYLEGEIDYPQMREKGIAATRQLAKRQFTWLRSWQEKIELNPYDLDNKQRVLQNLMHLT